MQNQGHVNYDVNIIYFCIQKCKDIFVIIRLSFYKLLLLPILALRLYNLKRTVLKALILIRLGHALKHKPPKVYNDGTDKLYTLLCRARIIFGSISSHHILLERMGVYRFVTLEYKTYFIGYISAIEVYISLFVE